MLWPSSQGFASERLICCHTTYRLSSLLVACGMCGLAHGFHHCTKRQSFYARAGMVHVLEAFEPRDLRKLGIRVLVPLSFRHAAGQGRSTWFGMGKIQISTRRERAGLPCYCIASRGGGCRAETPDPGGTLFSYACLTLTRLCALQCFYLGIFGILFIISEERWQ